MLINEGDDLLPILSAEVVPTCAQVISDRACVIGVANARLSVLANEADGALPFILLAYCDTAEHLGERVCPLVERGA